MRGLEEIKRSKFRIQDAHFSSVYYEKRDIDRPTLQELATCSFINHRRNVIFQSFTGSGKTFLACILGREACKKEIRTRYTKRRTRIRYLKTRPSVNGDLKARNNHLDLNILKCIKILEKCI